MESSNGTKVETISSLARWRVGELDTMKKWGTSKQRSYWFSDTFTIGIWEWFLVISKEHDNRRRLNIGLLMTQFSDSDSDSESSKRKFPIAKYVFRVFDNKNSRSPCISPIHETLYPSRALVWKTNLTLQSTFIVDVEILELSSPGIGGDDTCSGWSDVGGMMMMESIATQSTLSRMLKDGIHADVTINTADGGVLKAHKSVLSASSPVFASMFFHDLKEKETSTINIEDMSQDSCTALFCYIYGTIKQDDFWKQRISLLIAADKYGMTKLKDYCEESLLKDIRSSNVLERLQNAWLYQLDKLKKSCFHYLFDFGKVYDLEDEIDSFFCDVDQELRSEMFREMMKAWKHV